MRTEDEDEDEDGTDDDDDDVVVARLLLLLLLVRRGRLLALMVKDVSSLFLGGIALFVHTQLQGYETKATLLRVHHHGVSDDVCLFLFVTYIVTVDFL
jgi:hypothetical protein